MSKDGISDSLRKNLNYIRLKHKMKEQMQIKRTNSMETKSISTSALLIHPINKTNSEKFIGISEQ